MSENVRYYKNGDDWIVSRRGDEWIATVCTENVAETVQFSVENAQLMQDLRALSSRERTDLARKLASVRKKCENYRPIMNKQECSPVESRTLSPTPLKWLAILVFASIFVILGSMNALPFPHEKSPFGIPIGMANAFVMVGPFLLMWQKHRSLVALIASLAIFTSSVGLTTIGRRCTLPLCLRILLCCSVSLWGCYQYFGYSVGAKRQTLHLLNR